jgi:glycerol-3-phosphate O-acyltransferase
MAHRVLRSFLDAQLVVADRLAAADPAVPVDRAILLDECDRVGRQMLLQRRLHSPESVSRELFASAIDLVENFALLGPDDDDPDDLATRRREHLAFVSSLIDRATLIESLDAANRAEVTGVVV